MSFNIQQYLDEFPSNITKIDVSNKKLVNLPTLSRFNNLRELCCEGNQLTSLPLLPNTLTELYCEYNQLISLRFLGCLRQVDNLILVLK